MALNGIIFDVDGTLLDTNGAHVEAWRRAFEQLGYQVAPDRIAVEIGKGGDLLVPAVLGREAEAKHGKDLRQACVEQFLAIARQKRFRVFPGVEELLKTVRKRGLKSAVATSSKKEHLEAMLKSAGLDLKSLADEIVTADEATTSKPAPDLVVAAARKLGLTPLQCAMVGDTPYDAEACRRAGVACLALLCGGTGNTEEALRRAGAREVWRDARDLLDHLDRALAVASPGSASLTQELLDSLMGRALEAARAGLEKGEPPVGAVLARGDGEVIAAGHDEVRGRNDRTAHAAVVTFARAAGRVAPDALDLILVTTVEPCVLCTGAAMEARADVIVYGVQVPADSGTGRVLPPGHAGLQMPRIAGGVRADECRELLEAGLKRDAPPAVRHYLERLLGRGGEDK